MKRAYIVILAFVSLIGGCVDNSGDSPQDNGPLPIATNCPASTSPFPLVNQTQLDGEAKTEVIFSSMAVQDQLQVSLNRFLGSPVGSVPENQKDAPMYAEEQTRSLSLHTATRDPYRPFIMWGSWPGARTGLDNPDTIYRQMAVTAGASYRISGVRNQSSGLFFQLMDVWPGTDGTPGRTIAFLDDAEIVTDLEGNFTVTLDADPANGRDNHIQLPTNAHSLLIRDTLANWCETPSELEVERLTPDPNEIPPAPEQNELEMLAVTNIDSANQTWLRYTDILRSFAANSLTPPRATGGGLPGQYSSAGNFSLEQDQALVVTVDPSDAKYQGFQLGSDFFASFEHENYTSSLSAGQARMNADGTITYVISLDDPGVWNWLDPVGHQQGLMFVRWQGASVPPAAAPVIEVVKFTDLKLVLSEDLVRVTPEERSVQIKERAARLALRRDE